MVSKKEKTRKLLRMLKRKYNFEYREKNPFLILIKTILSQRTKDINTEKAASQLFAKAKTPEKILNMKNHELQKLIKASGFYREKAKRIKDVCRIIVENYNGNVPKIREELLKLPGVGYKTADIVLSYGFGIPTIAIDTHCNRIPKRIGIVDKDANVEEVRKTLEKFIHGNDRFIVNLGLVKFGQNICKPRNPKCEECELKNICNYYKMKKVF